MELGIAREKLRWYVLRSLYFIVNPTDPYVLLAVVTGQIEKKSVGNF